MKGTQLWFNVSVFVLNSQDIWDLWRKGGNKIIPKVCDVHKCRRVLLLWFALVRRAKRGNYLCRVTCQMLLKDFASGEEQGNTLKWVLEVCWNIFYWCCSLLENRFGTEIIKKIWLQKQHITDNWHLGIVRWNIISCETRIMVSEGFVLGVFSPWH